MHAFSSFSADCFPGSRNLLPDTRKRREEVSGRAEERQSLPSKGLYGSEEPTETCIQFPAVPDVVAERTLGIDEE